MDMTFALILIANIVLDVALLGLLAFVMTRPAKLTPHRPGVTGNIWRLHNPLRVRAERAAHGREAAAHGREERARRLSPALD